MTIKIQTVEDAKTRISWISCMNCVDDISSQMVEYHSIGMDETTKTYYECQNCHFKICICTVISEIFQKVVKN